MSEAAVAAIPRQVHVIWWQGWDAMPALLRERLALWQKPLAGYEVVFWDAQRLADLIAAMPEPNRSLWQQGWALARHDIQRIDLCKWAVLWAHGGMYSDLDMVFLRDPSQLWAQASFYICCETTAPWSPCNALMAAAPRLPFVLALAQQHVEALQRFCDPDRFTDTMNTTGPAELARILQKMAPWSPQVRVDEQIEHIYPVPWQARDEAVTSLSPQAYAVHLWAGLWK